MIELIPAIDIIDGQCVRLTKGDYDQKKVYADNPVEVARRFERMGFRRLHVVGLDGAKSHHIVNDTVLRDITAQTGLTVDFGGGIKTSEDIERAFDAGASMVTVGSVAVTQPQLFMQWLDTYGPERLILGADVRNGKVSINGWKDDSHEDLLPFLRQYVERGVRHVLCTELSKDGTLQGPAIDLYRQIMAEYPHLHLIASGGVSSNEDIYALHEAGIPAVVFGKAFYEGRIDIDRLPLGSTGGGGLTDLAVVQRRPYAGADKVSVNSAAIRRPQLIDEITGKFGSQVCVCAIDARWDDNDWYCYVKGGRERTPLRLAEWALEAEKRGAGEILFTSMNHDGVKTGFANEALAMLADRLSIPIIASGGAGEMVHFRDAFVIGKADAALAASVFHFGEIGIPQLKRYLRAEGVNVRL